MSITDLADPGTRAHPEVACTLVEAIPATNGTSVQMRLSFVRDGGETDEVFTRYLDLQAAVMLISRAS